jgi:hypothetical protein
LEARLSATADSISGPDTPRETAAPHASAPQSVPAAQPNATEKCSYLYLIQYILLNFYYSKKILSSNIFFYLNNII